MRGTASKVVVIVEDDVSMSHALSRILRLGGFAPLSHTSGESLLASAGFKEAACLIIDVQLPGINGFALRDRLASKLTLPPVIFISAFDEAWARESAAKANAIFLSKPFSGRALLETIRSLDHGALTTPITVVGDRL